MKYKITSNKPWFIAECFSSEEEAKDRIDRFCTFLRSFEVNKRVSKIGEIAIQNGNDFFFIEEC